MNRILTANATQLACPCAGKPLVPNWLPKLWLKNLSDQSGRRDLNPRPLDPQASSRAYLRKCLRDLR